MCIRDSPYVDLEFGTGCVKVTPAHDFNDYAVGQRHKLKMISILTLDGKIKSSPNDGFTYGHRAGRAVSVMSDNVLVGKATSEMIPEKYHGMDRFDARKQIVIDLEEQGFLVKTDKHKLKVPRGDRTGVVIEPVSYTHLDVYKRQVINRGFENCLSMFTVDSWNVLAEKVNKLNDFNPKVREFKRLFMNGANFVDVDLSLIHI